MSDNTSEIVPKKPVWKKLVVWGVWVVFALMVIANLTGCNSNVQNKIVSQPANQEAQSIEQDSQIKSISLKVDGGLVRKFVSDSEFFGLKKTTPDNLFFEHLQAPGYSIQLEGNSPDEMTGAKIEVSYESRNFGMGVGNIAGLIGILLDKDSSKEAIGWLNKQFYDAEVSVRQGKKPQESKLELDGIVIDFFPPTSLDKLSATVLVYGLENPRELQSSTTSINATDDFGVTVLARKAGEGNIEAVKKLLADGADPNFSAGYGEPPLLWAVRSSQDEIVKVLLEAGANPNYKSPEGATALKIAKDEGANVIIKCLLEYGATE